MVAGHDREGLRGRTGGRKRHRPAGRAARVAALAAVLAAAAPTAPLAAQSGGVGLPVGTPGPDAVVEDLEGNEVRLLDLVGGGPAVLEFWATWCEQCEALQPHMDELQARYGDRVRVVAVAVAISQNPRRIRRHLEDHDPGYPYVYDRRGEAVRAYEAPTTAVIVVLDAEGRVAYTGVGGDQDVMGAVRRVLGEG